jgi:CheY-like chemotaxis protein
MHPRVLVVDDHEDTVDLYVNELAAAGYDVQGAPGGNEALDIALKMRPDVAVLDISMPRMDGNELARLLRSYSPTRHLRIVAVSAFDFDPHAPPTPQGGWDGFLRKPLDPAKLVALVGAVLTIPAPQHDPSGPRPVFGAPLARKDGTDDE